MTNETLQTIRSRRSCRAYKPEQITKEELEEYLPILDEVLTMVDEKFCD